MTCRNIRHKAPKSIRVSLERMLLPTGYIDGDTAMMCFVRDYQGNVRQVVDEQGQTVEINNYYPYGMLALEPFLPGAARQPYKYTGKELDRQNGADTYDYHARTQLPCLGQFLQVDPKCEGTPWLSPYAFCAGNPIRNTDPTGCFITVDKEYQELFMGTLSSVFGDVATLFQFDDNNILRLEGGSKNLNEDQVVLFAGMQNLIDDKKHETTIVYEKEVDLINQDGVVTRYKPIDNGGEGTFLMGEVKGLIKNFIFIDPSVSQLQIPHPITDNNGNSTTIDFIYPTTKDDLLFHGFGHVLYKGKSQHSVVDFHNHARKLLNLKPLPYYYKHKYEDF